MIFMVSKNQKSLFSAFHWLSSGYLERKEWDDFFILLFQKKRNMILYSITLLFIKTSFVQDHEIVCLI